ncbi:HWE histidine kinase domain-containing protein [Martelella radicis]|uniref:Blue-light-activated histidine kinase n=1 Tax=Martelella radicis TaxID=1397476 RepID=A0A7W6KKH0_9HYPH|nr:two-component sensor histidine kinase [Martelella radicis]
MEYLPSDIVDAIKDRERLDTLSQTIMRAAEVDEDFVAIVESAALRFSCPAALILIADYDENWVQAVHGMKPETVSTRSGLFVYPIALQRDPALILNNPAEQEGIAPSVPNYEGEPVKFFAGAPIKVHGVNAGSLCVIDGQNHRDISDEDAEALRRLANLAGSLYELKDAARGKASADLALSRAQKRHSMALRAGNIAAWSWDRKSNTVECDNAMREMLGLPSGEPVTCRSLLSAIAPETRFPLMRRFKAALDRGEEYQCEFKAAKTGKWLLSLGGAYESVLAADQNGPVFGVVVDISTTKESEQKTRLLLRELNHRVKNTLAIVQSIAGQTLRRSRTSAEFNMAFSGRLQALSAAHTLLSDEQWGAIALDRLLRSQVAPYIDSNSRQIDIHGNAVFLDPDEALALGLVIHELASNAAKFGALSTRAGVVDITVACRDDDNGTSHLELDWVEVGGPPVTPPEQRGFGSVLIERSLDKVIGSKVDVDFADTGLRVHIRMPLRFC